MYELVEEATKVLREPTSEFDFENPPECPKEVEKNLSEAMERFGGIGLSANQLGLDYRVFVMRTADSGIKAFFNPEVTKLSKETEMMKEGCLTYPFLFLSIKRPRKCVVKYTDENGDLKEGNLDGMISRIFQHEYDHMEGTDFTHKVSRLKIERAMKKFNKTVKRLRNNPN